MVPLSFADTMFQIAGPAALYWPARNALLVADLHLEKASFFAGVGQMLPPYDSHATLSELAALIEATGAETVFCLGDNYHDDAGEARLQEQAAALLCRMTGACDWIWISGNHDRDVAGLHGGRVMAEWIGDGVALRHEATPGTRTPEISGHFHPKLSVNSGRKRISRPCFVRGPRHLIMPAFGALTGGLAAEHPAIERAVGGPAEALLGLSGRLISYPLGFPARKAERAISGDGAGALAVSRS